MRESGSSKRIETWQIIGALILLITITGLVVWRIRKSSYLAVGWLWFVGSRVVVMHGYCIMLIVCMATDNMSIKQLFLR